MSRVGAKPISIPAGVKVAVAGQTVRVEGPAGKLSWTHRPECAVSVDETQKIITVSRKGEDRVHRSLHGLTRSLIANMVQGCAQGYSRSLELFGVGYGVQVAGKKFTASCGFSHPVAFDIPEGLTVEVTTPQARGDSEPARFTVKGADKRLVGEFAAEVRKTRKPEPYKGKGFRYVGEYVRRKVGKAFAGTAGAS
jgi:large subunit ribosomal protein L6